MSDIDDVMRREAKRLGLGPTGEYPQGTLGPDDEGGLKAAMTVVGGKIVINFGKEISWLAMTPGEARILSEALLKNAGKAEKQSGDGEEA